MTTKYSDFFDAMDPDVRNTAMLLETLQEAYEQGEVDITEFGVLADDIFELIDYDRPYPKDVDEQRKQLHTITTKLIEG